MGRYGMVTERKVNRSRNLDHRPAAGLPHRLSVEYRHWVGPFSDALALLLFQRWGSRWGLVIELTMLASYLPARNASRMTVRESISGG
jgi:hypothetical protein